MARTPRSGVSQLEAGMYAWIDGEEWAASACPALSEEHGWLVDETSGETFGRILSEPETTVVRQALLAVQLELPLGL